MIAGIVSAVSSRSLRGPQRVEYRPLALVARLDEDHARHPVQVLRGVGTDVDAARGVPDEDDRPGHPELPQQPVQVGGDVVRRPLVPCGAARAVRCPVVGDDRRVLGQRAAIFCQSPAEPPNEGSMTTAGEPAPNTVAASWCRPTETITVPSVIRPPAQNN